MLLSAQQRDKCLKADLSMPGISPRETGDTQPLPSSTARSVKHRGRCRSWSWSSSNFRQKSKFLSEPLELTPAFPATLQRSLRYPRGFSLNLSKGSRFFASHGYSGSKSPRRGCAGISRKRELLRGSGISPMEPVPSPSLRTVPLEALGAAAA